MDIVNVIYFIIGVIGILLFLTYLRQSRCKKAVTFANPLVSNIIEVPNYIGELSA
uniref:Uncharacterized protein n=1 Tax=viral metagenome TaxID=1070528 RepID=A0A6C0CKX7_9ZZZZ